MALWGLFGVWTGWGGSDWQLRIMKVAEKKEEDTEKTKTRNLEIYVIAHSLKSRRWKR